jgi:hypothetical protein
MLGMAHPTIATIYARYACLLSGNECYGSGDEDHNRPIVKKQNQLCNQKMWMF